VQRPGTPKSSRPSRHQQHGNRGGGVRRTGATTFIAQVAALCHQAKALGGEPARKPWRNVAARLKERGLPNVTDGQLKNWSCRAKYLGLLTKTTKIRKESG
jgi:hypothetical protein